MRWDQLFADLEARLDAEERAATETDVADLVRAERARLALRDRLRAHLGEPLTWSLGSPGPGSASFAGAPRDVGADWVLVATSTGDLLIPIGALQTITGLSWAAAPEAGEVARRLGITVILRGLARDRTPVSVRLSGGQSLDGTIDRVGADHVDVAVHPHDEPRRDRAVLEVRCVLLSAVVAIAVR